MSDEKDYPAWLYKGGDPTAEATLVQDADEEEAADGFERAKFGEAPAKATKAPKAGK